MLTPRDNPASTLFRSVRVANILIADERIVYNERKHWASLLPVFFDTMALFILIVIGAGGVPTGPFGFLLFFVVGVVALTMVLRGRWNRYLVIGAIVLVVASMVNSSMFSLVVLAIIATSARFVYKFAMWAFYERLFITNRRLIFASGFWDSEIAMMPLTRITDISYKRPAIADLLGYGQLRVETAGQDQALGFIDFINHPNEFYELLINRSTTSVGPKPATIEVPEAEPKSETFPSSGQPTSRFPPTEEIPFEGYGPQI